jgi:hypothetical protein
MITPKIIFIIGLVGIKNIAIKAPKNNRNANKEIESILYYNKIIYFFDINLILNEE